MISLRRFDQTRIKIIIRRKECGTYLAAAHRHRSRVKMTMKNDK